MARVVGQPIGRAVEFKQKRVRRKGKRAGGARQRKVRDINSIKDVSRTQGVHSIKQV